MILSHAQFAKNGWQNRNQIRQGNETQYLTVPVRHRGRFGQALKDLEIAGGHWRKKHLKSIYWTYKGRPYFETYYPALEEILGQDWERISELNICIIKQILGWLDVCVKVVDSRDYDLEGNKTDLIISACKAVGARSYVSNPGAVAYIDEKKFENAGIEHLWQKFTHPRYEQGRDFIPNLSIIDLLFNTGPAARDIVRSASRFVKTPPGTSPADERIAASTG